jgi:hypothetical protein
LNAPFFDIVRKVAEPGKREFGQLDLFDQQ